MPSPNVAIEDIDAYSDSGSTISLASCGSGGNEFSPRPPRDGSIRSKSVRGRRSKISNNSRSPYASRQLLARKNEPTKSMGRNLWMTAMKNGTGSLSTNNTTMNTWAGARPPHANKKRPGSRTRNFSDVVDLTDGKSKFFSKSATMSYSEPYISSGGPALKPAEDYYDEVIELKKIINLLKEENNRINTKLHRVEEDNVKKDRHIEDLLNSRKQPEDLRRTLTDKRGDSSSIVTSLKQKLHAVERIVKEKETEINKMKKDLKTTDVEELKIQSEVYYQEVQRLQFALLQVQQERMDELYEEDTPSSTFNKSSVNVPNQKLQRDMEALKAENKNLKKELISVVEDNSNLDENKKQLRVEYADMTRGQLLQAIHKLEMRVDKTKAKALNLNKEKDDLTNTRGSRKKRDRKNSTSSNTSTADNTESDLLEENEKQRKIIEKLKEDRTHYRLIADNLRKQLTARESEIEGLQLQLSKNSSQAGVVGSSARKASITSTSSQYSPRKESITVKEREEMMEREFYEFQQRHAAKVLQKQWRTYKGSKDETRRQEEDAAAQTLQREWRKHLKNKESTSQNEAITDIQAAFRGHLTRKERLNAFGDYDIDSDDAIVDLQSALRGHLTRTKDSQDPEDDQRSLDMLRNGQFSESGDSDDAIVISKPGSSGYRRLSADNMDKSPFSAKKRSSFTGLTKNINPQRTIDEANEESDEDVVSSRTINMTLCHVSSRDRPAKPTSRFEIVDSDDDEDDVVVPTIPTKSNRGKSTKEIFGSDEDDIVVSTTKAPKISSRSSIMTTSGRSTREIVASDDNDVEDDIVVSTNKASKISFRGSTRTAYGKSKTEIVDNDAKEDDVVVSSKKRLGTNSTRRSNKSDRVNSTREIVDSDEENDDIVVSTKRSSEERSSRSSEKSDRGRSTKGMQSYEDSKTKNKSSKKVQKKIQRFDAGDSEDDSDEDDVVVTSSKSGGLGSRSSTSKKTKTTSTTKRGSLVDSLLAPAPRSSMDNRGRKLFTQDDDGYDDDDDDDMVMSAFSKRDSIASSASKKKDSLASLWSDSQPKKKSSFGFSSFEDSFSSKNRNTSSLDDLF